MYSINCDVWLLIADRMPLRTLTIRTSAITHYAALV